MSKSKIEWTERTWNPTTGCSKVSEGCKNCYALRMSWRNQNNPGSAAKYAGTTKKTEAGNINFTGHINLLQEVLAQPLSWKKPSLVFVNSMSDLFHENVPFEFIDAVFSVMADVDRHTYQVLTKRPERLLEFIDWKEKNAGIFWTPSDNIWLGVSVENQKAADERIPLLLTIPEVVKFLSCEPLLGPLDLSRYIGIYDCMNCGYRGNDFIKEGKYKGCPGCASISDFGLASENFLTTHISWIIAGGESGPGARPMHPDWVRSLRDQCKTADVNFFFKQWGEWAPVQEIKDWEDFKTPEANNVAGESYLCKPDGSHHDKLFLEPLPSIYLMEKRGKKTSGALLDGEEHRQFPIWKGAEA